MLAVVYWSNWSERFKLGCGDQGSFEKLQGLFIHVLLLESDDSVPSN